MYEIMMTEETYRTYNNYHHLNQLMLVLRSVGLHWAVEILDLLKLNLIRSEIITN